MNAYRSFHISFMFFASIVVLVTCAVLAPFAWAEEAVPDASAEDALRVTAATQEDVAASPGETDDGMSEQLGQKEPDSEGAAGDGLAKPAAAEAIVSSVDETAGGQGATGLADTASVQGGASVDVDSDDAEVQADAVSSGDSEPITPQEGMDGGLQAEEPSAGAQPAPDGQETQNTTPQTPAAKKDSARIVADGVYWMVAYSNTKQAVAMPKVTTKAGVQAKLAKKAKRAAWQKWVFVWRNGSYEIINAFSGKALAAKSRVSGSKVVQAKRANVKSQRWILTRSANGKYVVIRNERTGLVLNIFGKAKAGAKLVAANVAKKTRQRFVLKKTNLVDAGTYALATKLGASQVAAVVKKASSRQAALVKSGSSLAQRFYVRNEAHGLFSMQSVSSGLFLADAGGKVALVPWAASDASLLWRGSYDAGVRFTNSSTGRALAVDGGKAASGVALVTANPKAGNAQRWKPLSRKLLKAGTFTVSNASGSGALAVKGGSYARGASVQLASSDPASGARCFKLQAVGSCFRIVNMRTYQAVAVKGASAKNGANVVQVATSSAKAQLWKPSINRDGSISFKNAASGKMLAKANRSANVVQKAADTSSFTGWKLKAVKRYSLSGNTKLDKGLAGILATHSTLRAAYNCIRDNYRWDSPDTAYRSGKYMSDKNTKRYALQMIERGKGSCYCTSSTVMWLARALGYDADVTVGYLHSNIPGVIGAHSWVEVRKGGVPYVCDADCERGLRAYDFFMKRYAQTPTEYHFW